MFINISPKPETIMISIHYFDDELTLFRLILNKMSSTTKKTNIKQEEQPLLESFVQA